MVFYIISVHFPIIINTIIIVSNIGCLFSSVFESVPIGRFSKEMILGIEKFRLQLFGFLLIQADSSRLIEAVLLVLPLDFCKVSYHEWITFPASNCISGSLAFSPSMENMGKTIRIYGECGVGTAFPWFKIG
ncbi:hypothetical protein P7H19_02050 [Paenibacillus larvae]|nr:hypothetical protein [Paenibacillus larvae]MDT2235399.1 hypothetical protein [Paenibacillus larvae]